MNDGGLSEEYKEQWIRIRELKRRMAHNAIQCGVNKASTKSESRMT